MAGLRPHAVRRVTASGGTSKTVQVRAYSTPCNDGVRATMELWVNGVKQQTWTNVASTWTTYQQSVTLSGNDQIDVLFTNDCNAGGYDRNLYVDYVVVDGRTIQAEGGAAVVDKGAGDAAFDGLNVIAGQQNLYWNAALRFVVGPKAYAACYDANGNMTWRLQDGVAYEQTRDCENRLAAVTNRKTGEATTFTYDGNGTLVKKVEVAGTTTYVGGHYEVQSLAGKKAIDVTDLRNGVACKDDATGSGYILYSAENVHSRFAAHLPYSTNADHFLCVIYDNGWRYDDNNTYFPFASRSTDILVAEVSFDTDTVTSLAGQNSARNGIVYGYAGGNLSFEANVFAGVSNVGEFYLTGSSLTAHSGGASVTRYYTFNGQRIAMRRDGVLQYLAGDHLGTTNLVLDASGNKVAESRHYPYGGQRWTNATLPTDYRFTGALQEAGLGLYHMGARFYDSSLARWISADTLVPEPGNPQSLNRYSYCLNNPLKYIDPSGHDELWAWRNRWYNAHGWYWNSETGHWDIQGKPYFADPDILDEVIANSPEVFGASEVGFHFEPSFDQAALVLRASVLSWHVAGVTDLECLARSAERATGLSTGNPVSFMWLMNAIFGHTGRGLGNEENPFRPSPIGPYSTYGTFTDSGFATHYQDPYGNSDQVHHFWFYVQLSFWDAVVGSNSAVMGNLYHEHWPAESGRSAQDYWLGNEGIKLGYRLGRGLSVYDVASFIRSLGSP